MLYSRRRSVCSACSAFLLLILVLLVVSHGVLFKEAEAARIGARHYPHYPSPPPAASPSPSACPVVTPTRSNLPSVCPTVTPSTTAGPSITPTPTPSVTACPSGTGSCECNDDCLNTNFAHDYAGNQVSSSSVCTKLSVQWSFVSGCCSC